VATSRLRRDRDRDCDILVSADAIPTMRVGVSPRCIGSYMLFCETKTVHSEAFAKRFDTCDEAETAAAFTAVARQRVKAITTVRACTIAGEVFGDGCRFSLHVIRLGDGRATSDHWLCYDLRTWTHSCYWHFSGRSSSHGVQ
jgi:hypothetical protein